MKQLETIAPLITGTWRYAGSIPCEVRIVRHNTLYGSGDDEDSPQIANDREVECFYILYQTPVGEPPWVGGGVALSVDEAVALVESTLGDGIAWKQ